MTFARSMIIAFEKAQGWLSQSLGPTLFFRSLFANCCFGQLAVAVSESVHCPAVHYDDALEVLVSQLRNCNLRRIQVFCTAVCLNAAPKTTLGHVSPYP
eukprot:3932096-Rhodomonas_salina.3